MPSSVSPRSLSAPALSTLCKVSSASAVLVSFPSFFPARSFPQLTLPTVRLSRAHSKDRNRQPVGLVLFAHPRSKDERQRDNVVIDAFNAQWASVDPKNTKVFVGGISQRVLLQDVVARFAVMGTITNVNFGKGCAFISFARKLEAGRAIEALNGMVFDGKPLRVTWSRSSGMFISFLLSIFVALSDDFHEQSNHSSSSNAHSSPSSLPSLRLNPSSLTQPVLTPVAPSLARLRRPSRLLHQPRPPTTPCLRSAAAPSPSLRLPVGPLARSPLAFPISTPCERPTRRMGLTKAWLPWISLRPA